MPVPWDGSGTRRQSSSSNTTRSGLRSQDLRAGAAVCAGAHILKPDTQQPRYTPSAINEYACMQLARALKLPVPATWLLRVPEAAYVVERHDHVTTASDIVGLHQIDGCQLLGRGPGWKYERTGGLASIPNAYARAARARARPARLPAG